ncbi:sensor histidine kinase [Thermophagus sp. OGC60D27]|uniref:sensor histidine kinase n=1 Tax=Thermophagus sp. OGC60D27 TaxID=3458415 RepID=UPI004037E458
MTKRGWKEFLAVIGREWQRLGRWHILLWVGYSIVFFYGPAIFFDTQTAIILTIRTLGINSLIFYVNILILLPLLMGRNKLKGYIVSLVVFLSFLSFIYHITDPIKPETWEQLRVRKVWVPNETPPHPVLEMPGDSLSFEGRNIELSRRSRDPRPKGELFPRRVIFGALPFLGMFFLSTLFWIFLEAKRKEKEQLSLTNQNLETEMKFLKSQMNPHFLFNALNNIYSLSQQGNPNTSKLILKLSSMLRYILYETDDKKIPIGREVDYILDYVEFQKIKLEEEPNLEIDFTQIDRDRRIEPMLIFPFVENAFKHGNIDNTKKGRIVMRLQDQDGCLSFFILNTKPRGHVSKDQSKGIGIENVKKRLSFLYKGKYRLNIADKPDVFEVQLEIDT